MSDVYAIASEVVAFIGGDHHNSTGNMPLAARVSGDPSAAGTSPRPNLLDAINYLRQGGEDDLCQGLFAVLRGHWFLGFGLFRRLLWPESSHSNAEIH